MRAPNAIDFWRGYALICIYLDHLRYIDHLGIVFLASLTLRHFAVSTAAELFVFLAGWSLSLATGGPIQPHSAARILARVSGRAIQIYMAQLVITAIALATLAAAALLFNDPHYLHRLNAGPVFAEPVPFTLGWVSLSYQLALFNILPLYVALLVITAPLILLARKRLGLALLLSFALYGVCIVFGIKPPSWPHDPGWFFNPFCWQFLFMLGFAAAELHAKRALEPWVARLWPAALAIVMLGALAAFAGSREAAVTPSDLGGNLFSLSAPYQPPARLINMLALAIVFSRAFPAINGFLPRCAGVLCALGRHSLPVFSVGSILLVLYVVAFTRLHMSPLVAIAFIVSGVAAMVLTARLLEWRRAALKRGHKPESFGAVPVSRDETPAPARAESRKSALQTIR